MRWCEGGIAEAVALSRKNNSVFVVYVEGKDDKSTNLTKIIDADEISQLLESDAFVAIKIEANSVPHQQFSEIYKQVNVPSVYFIGKSGAPLEIIEEVNGSAEFVQKINGILSKNGSPSSSNLATKVKVTSDFILQEAKTDGISCENDVCVKKSNDAASSSQAEGDLNESIKSTDTKGSPEVISTETEQFESADSTSKLQVESDLSQEDKVERAKALVEKKRHEKQQEEEEKEKNQEIERRKMGQDVQKLKRWQQDQELRNVLEEREKEKKEQQAARQRILAQIEQDKADRAARFSTNPQSSQHSPPITAQPPANPRTPTNSHAARLQFRLPDGSSHTNEFSSSNTLTEVRNYIKSNLTLSFKNFALGTAFPRREFGDEHDLQTLQELELVPTAVILILPIAQGTVASNPNSFTSFLWYLIAPILNILGYLKNMLFGGPKSSSSDVSTGQESKRPFDSSSEHSRPLPKRRAGETSVIRRQGNVHRLTDKTDSDDENNTWNGNSTQQM